MTYKKTWLSYLLWAVYTCLTGVMLANYAILFWQKKINAPMNYGTVLFVLFVFGATVGIYILIHNIFRKAGENGSISSHTKFLWEIFIALSIFSAGLLYRISLYLQNINTLTETTYYQMATVKAEEAGGQLVHGASYLYTMCLSFVLSFLGNKIAAAVWMQILIQMVTILLAFFTVRRLAGRIPACIVMLVLSVSSVYAGQILVMVPESLFFSLYLAGMFIVGGYVKNVCQHRTDRKSAITGALLSGFIIGFLTYLDAAAITLFIFLAGLLTGVCREKAGKRQKKNVEKNSTAGFSLLLIAISLVTGGLVFVGMLALNAYSYYIETEAMAKAWFELYRAHLSIDLVFYQTEYSIVECLILTVLAAFLIMAFWNRRKVQNVTVWFLLMFLLAPTPLAATGVLSCQVYSVFIWGVLAGLGIQQSLVWEKVIYRKPAVAAEVASAMEEGKPEEPVVEATPVSMNEPVVEAAPVPTEEPVMEAAPVSMEEPVMEVAPVSMEEPVVEAAPVSMEEPVVEATPVSTEEPVEKPRFLENPLPLPKKHEKRTMDYQYEVTQEKMEFDIEIEENDDFDIA